MIVILLFVLVAIAEEGWRNHRNVEELRDELDALREAVEKIKQRLPIS
jgi:hypothetical protein